MIIRCGRIGAFLIRKTFQNIALRIHLENQLNHTEKLVSIFIQTISYEI